MWQEAQATLAWPLVSGKPKAVWSKVPSDHFVIGWQEAQAAAVFGNPALMWSGTFPPRVGVLFQSLRWQPMQSAELSVKLLLMWQEAQGVGLGDACVPVSAKPVTL